MTIEELIVNIGNYRYIDADYSMLDKCGQEACKKANETVDYCVKLVKDFQKENSRPDKRFAIVQQLLESIADDAPDDDDDLETVNRQDLIEMYADVLNLLQSMKIVEENELKFGRDLSKYDALERIRQVIVTDDWYPCVDGNKIDLHLMLFCYPSSYQDYGNYCAKLTAWGGDDSGIEIERICWDLPSALKEYNQLLEIYNAIPDGVSRRWLCEKYDFRPA